MSTVVPSRRIASLSLLGAALLLALSQSVYASHFRFGHITWVRASPTSNTVNFTVRMAWRTGAVDVVTLNFGDGSPAVCVGSTIGGGFVGNCGGAPPFPWVDEGTFTDIANESFTVVSAVVPHTYATEGPFLVTWQNCCRIYALVNASGASYRMEVCVDLRNGNQGSAASSLPVIVQFPKTTLGTSFTFPLPVGDPDLDPIACRFATLAESGIPSIPSAGGLPLTLSGCDLVWDTSSTVVGQKYAVQVMLESTHAGNVCKVPLDFIIEITGGIPPTCTAVNGGNSVIPVGTPFAASATGTDPAGGNLTMTVIGSVPAGMTINPAPGTTQASPFPVSLSWTPTIAQVNQVFSFNVVFTKPGGLNAVCSFGLTVPSLPSFGQTPCGPGQLILANVGIPVVVPIEAFANTQQLGEFVTITLVSGLPAGATFAPALPVIGQPANTTLNWTPVNAQIGSHIITLRATDQLGQSTDCPIHIDVAECLLLLGTDAINDPITLPGQAPDYLLVRPLFWFPTTMEVGPEFYLPNDPSLLGLSFYAQIGMYNPQMFPNDPLQLSRGGMVTIGQGMTLYGTGTTGWNMWTSGAPNIGSSFRFLFHIPGM